MGQIQRYTFSRCKLHFDPHVCLCGKLSHPNGDLVLYADHLEAMAAQDEQIRKLREALQACRLQLLQSNNNGEYADEALNMASEALEAK